MYALIHINKRNKNQKKKINALLRSVGAMNEKDETCDRIPANCALGYAITGAIGVPHAARREVSRMVTNNGL
jgi:hypothetical protein